MSFREWNRNVMMEGLGVSPVDVVLTWIRLYKESEELRRNQKNVF
jgi:hypothetical protein